MRFCGCTKITTLPADACKGLGFCSSSLEQVQLRSGKGKEATKSDLKLAIRSSGLSPPSYKTVCPNLQAWFYASLSRQISSLPTSTFFSMFSRLNGLWLTSNKDHVLFPKLGEAASKVNRYLVVDTNFKLTKWLSGWLEIWGDNDAWNRV